MLPRRAQPKILVLYNDNPDWPAADREWSQEMLDRMWIGLDEQGYEYQPVPFFDDLSGLDGCNAREWLVLNWGEEFAGQPWSEALVAEALEQRGLAYTGSPPATFRGTQNRMAVKQALRAAGLPTLPARVLADPAEARAWDVYPAIVKGLNQHSSYGLGRESVVDDAAGLGRRVAYLRETFGDQALVEPFLDTREFHVAVWGNAAPVALPPLEYDYAAFADPHDRLYTYEWKFDRQSRGFNEIKMPCPAPADRPDWRARLETLAVAAYRVCGLRDYGRLDFRMLGDEPHILDVNPNPDLDIASVLPIAAGALGLTFGQMVDRILQFAAERMPS